MAYVVRVGVAPKGYKTSWLVSHNDRYLYLYHSCISVVLTVLYGKAISTYYCVIQASAATYNAMPTVVRRRVLVSETMQLQATRIIAAFDTTRTCMSTIDTNMISYSVTPSDLYIGYYYSMVS